MSSPAPAVVGTRSSKRQAKRKSRGVSSSGGRDDSAASLPSSSSSLPVAAAASVGAARVGGRPVALVLGMANTSAAYRDSLVVRPGTTYGSLRDHLRLADLSLRYRLDVITMNDKQSEQDCDGYMHYRGEFGSRTASGLQRQFGPKGRPLQLTAVFLDYFRFPPGYIQIAYLNVCPMLGGLVEAGMVREDCAMVLPNFPELRDRLFSQFERREARTLRRRKMIGGKESLEMESVYLTYDALPATQYPLYAVTEKLWNRTPGAITDRKMKRNAVQTDAIANALGGFCHKDEISLLRAEAPFVQLRVTTDEAESKRSFQATFYSCNTPPPVEAAAPAPTAKRRKLK